jgi:hypothetical protein
MIEFKASIDIENQTHPTPSPLTISGESIEDVLRQAKVLAMEFKKIAHSKCIVSVMISNILFIRNSELESVL